MPLMSMTVTGFRVIEALNYCFGRMKKIYADGSYRGELVENVKNKFGRLAKDYEYKVTASTAMIHLAFITLMLNKLFFLISQ